MGLDVTEYAIKIIDGYSSGPHDLVLKCNESIFNIACDTSKPLTVIEYVAGGSARCIQLSYQMTVDNRIGREKRNRLEGAIFNGKGDVYYPDVCAIFFVLTRFWQPIINGSRLHPSCKVLLQTVDGCSSVEILPEFVKQIERNMEYVEDFMCSVIDKPSESGEKMIKEGIPYKRVYVHKGRFTEEVVLAICDQHKVRGYPIYEEVLGNKCCKDSR